VQNGCAAREFQDARGQLGEPEATGCPRRRTIAPAGKCKEAPPLDTPATYLNWNFILISVPNLLMIIGMVVVFVVALVAPFPSHDEAVEPADSRDA
jgi:hypothetical protein